MENMIIEEYMTKIKSLEEKEYLFGVISYGIAPTLFKDKPSSIITLRRDNGRLNVLWERYKYIFLEKYKIDFFELKKNEYSAVILFYYPDEIKSIIYNERNMNFLSKFGYSKNLNLIQNLFVLKKRFQNICPHEIGVFLGYPLDDVICFIEQSERQCLMCGYWKVYNDVDTAKEIFVNYDEARYNIAKSVIQGVVPSMIMNIFETISCR
ncbi:DUF3793 family protein [Clostridium sp. LBM24168]